MPLPIRITHMPEWLSCPFKDLVPTGLEVRGSEELCVICDAVSGLFVGAIPTRQGGDAKAWLDKLMGLLHYDNNGRQG